MSKSLTRNKLNSKASRGSGGGGGTGNMNTSTYDPAGLSRQLLGTAVALTQAEAAAKTDWLEGQLYCITDPPAPLQLFYSFAVLTPDNVYILPGLRDSGFGYTINNTLCEAIYLVTGSAGSELKYIKDLTNGVEIGNNGVGSTAKIAEQYRLSGTNCKWINCTTTDTSLLTDASFNNCEFLECTVNADGFSGCYITNYAGINDSILFTNKNQFLDGINKGVGRSFSFINTSGLNYTNCTVGSGKTITIRSSQTDRYWIADQSSFQEEFDVADTSLYDGILKQMDLSNFGHAGHIKIVNSGGVTSPTFINVIGLPAYEMCYEFFTDSLTCNPQFQPGSGNVLVNTISLVSSAISLIGDSDSVTADNKAYGVFAGSLRILDAVIM